MEGDNNQTGVRKEKPPIGKLRNLNAEEREVSISIPFTKLEKYPELIDNFLDITDGINEARNTDGLPVMEFATSDVRLIDASLYDSHPYFSEQVKMKADGLFDPITGFVFIRFDDQAFSADRSGRSGKVDSSYTLAHELSHKGMGEGLRAYSFSLDEGLTDWTAREIMQERILRKYLAQEDIFEVLDYISEQKPELDGIAVTKDDILLAEPGKPPVHYSRIPEMRLIEKIKLKHPDVFDQLWRNAFHGDATSAENTMKNTYGIEISTALRSPHADLTTLAARL